jgi:lysozyme
VLNGRDVSNHQGKYDWTGVNPKPAFGFAKATEGLGFVDSYLPWNWGEMYRLGILRGAYHFGHPSQEADAQAQLFVNTVKKAGGIGVKDVLVLDLEVTDGLGPSAVAAWAVELCRKVEKLTGKNVWVYTDKSFIWNGCCAGLYDRPLWIAFPTVAGQPGPVGPWQVWTCHQYGEDKNAVDLDVFNGTADTWAKLANMPAPPVVYKTVPAMHVCDGKETIQDLSKVLGAPPSALLRMTCEHSANGLFTATVAAWLNMVLRGPESHIDAPLPKGATIWYPEKVKAS